MKPAKSGFAYVEPQEVQAMLEFYNVPSHWIVSQNVQQYMVNRAAQWHLIKRTDGSETKAIALEGVMSSNQIDKHEPYGLG